MVTIRLHNHKPAPDPRIRGYLVEIQALSEQLTTLAKLAHDAIAEAQVAGVDLPGLKELADYLSEQFQESPL